MKQHTHQWEYRFVVLELPGGLFQIRYKFCECKMVLL